MATLYKNAYAKAQPSSGFKKILGSMSRIQRVKLRINESALDDSALREGLVPKVVCFVKIPWPVMSYLRSSAK